MGVVGGEERDVHPPRELDQLLVEAGLLGDPGVLDLDEVVPIAQDGPIVVGDLHGCLFVAVGQAAKHLSTEARAGRDQPLAVGGEQVAVDSGLVVVAVEMGRRNQAEQVAIPGLVLGQQDEVVVVRIGLAVLVGVAPRSDVRLDPDDGLHARCRSGLGEGNRPVQRPVVGQGHRGHAELGHSVRELGEPGQAVEQAEFRVNVEMDEVVSGGRHGGVMVLAGPVSIWRSTASNPA